MKKKKEEIVKTEIGISKDDIIAVAVSEIEDEIKRRVSSITEEIEECSTSIKDKEKEKEDIYKDKEEEVLKVNFIKIEKQVTAINIPFSKSIMKMSNLSKVKYSGMDIHDYRNLISAYSGNRGELKKNSRYVVALVNKAYYEHVEIEYPEEKIKELSDNIEKLTEKRSELGVKRSKVKAQLSEIPSIERKAKAALARQALSSSVEGQSYLDEMEKIKDGFKQTLKLIN